MGQFDLINQKLDQFGEKLKECSDDVKNVSNSLQHPDKGIYARIRQTESQTNRLEEWMAEHEVRDGELRTNVENLTKSMKPLTDDYIIRMSNKKWSDKIVWTVIAIILGLMIPIVWVTFTGNSVKSVIPTSIPTLSSPVKNK